LLASITSVTPYLFKCLCALCLPAVAKGITCGDTDPLANANTPFICPDGTEFDPTTAGTTPPSPQACCKVWLHPA
jgi:hypothetical protein